MPSLDIIRMGIRELLSPKTKLMETEEYLEFMRKELSKKSKKELIASFHEIDKLTSDDPLPLGVEELLNDSPLHAVMGQIIANERALNRMKRHIK